MRTEFPSHCHICAEKLASIAHNELHPDEGYQRYYCPTDLNHYSVQYNSTATKFTNYSEYFAVGKYYIENRYFRICIYDTSDPLRDVLVMRELTIDNAKYIPVMTTEEEVENWLML